MSAAAQPESLPSPELDLEALFEAHHTRVLQAAYRITGSPGDAEDVLQTVFLRLLRRESGTLEPSPEAYLHRAAVNAALDLLRQRRRTPSVPLETSPAAQRAPAAEGPEHARRGREVEDWLRGAVARLNPQEAAVFVLHAFEGRDHQEIADALGVSRNAVAVALHRARRQLKDAFREFEGDLP